MDWKANKDKLLNPLGCAFRLYPHAALVAVAYRDSKAKIDYCGQVTWEPAGTPMWKGRAAYRVNPAWLDAKIAEQGAAEANAKECAWVDMPIEYRSGLPFVFLPWGAQIGLHKAERMATFAGIVAQNGRVHKSWDDYCFNNSVQGAYGNYSITAPKSVRMWKESAK